MSMPSRKRGPFAVARPSASAAGAEANSTAGTRRRKDVVAQIRELIQALVLQPGDRLPSERKLAGQFGVSRGTLREAMQFLEALNLVEIRQGRGCFLHSAGSNGDKLRSGWLLWVRRHRGHILEALEVRLGCEVFAAELAARRAGPEELAQLVDALRTMKAASQARDAPAFAQSDLAFHDALLRAASNTTLHELAGALGRELIPERAAISEVAGRTSRSLLEHSAIYAAVQAGDGPGAARAMRRHLESVKHDVLVHLIGTVESAEDVVAERRQPIVEPAPTRRPRGGRR